MRNKNRREEEDGLPRHRSHWQSNDENQPKKYVMLCGHGTKSFEPDILIDEACSVDEHPNTSSTTSKVLVEARDNVRERNKAREGRKQGMNGKMGGLSECTSYLKNSCRPGPQGG